MLVMLLIGWLAVLPAVVVAGLYVVSRRGDRRAPQAVDLDQVIAFVTRSQRSEPVRETSPRVGAHPVSY
jgi:hypothetical protein